MIERSKLERKVRSLPKGLRIACGILLVLGGLFAILPILGFWMVPLGIAILAVDIPWVRQYWRRFLAWLRRQPMMEWLMQQYEAWRARYPWMPPAPAALSARQNSRSDVALQGDATNFSIKNGRAPTQRENTMVPPDQHECSELVARIDKALSVNPMLSDSQIKEVRRLRDEVTAACSAGKHADAERAERMALAIVKGGAATPE